MLLSIHETTRSLFYKTLECIKIQRREEMQNHEVQEICTRTKGKLDPLSEACYMRIVKRMHNMWGFKDIFARLWRRFMTKKGMKQVFYWDSETVKVKKRDNSMRVLTFFESWGRILHL